MEVSGKHHASATLLKETEVSGEHHASATLLKEKNPQFPSNGWLVGYQSQYGRNTEHINLLLLSGFESQTIQPVD